MSFSRFLKREELIKSYEKEVESDTENIKYLNALSFFYQGILLDREKSLIYSKKVFDLAPDKSNWVADKLNYLFQKKKFDEAREILQDSSLVKYLEPVQKDILFHDFYFFQHEYEKAAPFLEQVNPEQARLQA